jgi:BlaI family transcriptional regulator, penicillinase repressor
MHKLTPSELAVMQLLWEHGEMKPAEIQKLYPEPIKNPALRSLLTILHDKGHVARRKVGKAFYYQALTRQASAFRTVLRDFVDNYCGGSLQSLLLNVIQTEKLSREELVELQRLAAREPSPRAKRKQP